MLNFASISGSIPFILEGTTVILKYATISIALGFMLGSLLAVGRTAGNTPLRMLTDAYVSIFRGTPLLLQLSIVYFVPPQAFNYQISSFEAGVIAFSLNSAAYVCEVVRGGIQSLEKGQKEAALSLGLSHTQAYAYIILPQAYRNSLPALVNEVIGLFKETSLLSIIMEMDLLRRANIVAAEKYVYFEPLLVVGAVYYSITLMLSYLAAYLEKMSVRND